MLVFQGSGLDATEKPNLITSTQEKNWQHWKPEAHTGYVHNLKRGLHNLTLNVHNITHININVTFGFKTPILNEA